MRNGYIIAITIKAMTPYKVIIREFGEAGIANIMREKRTPTIVKDILFLELFVGY